MAVNTHETRFVLSARDRTRLALNSAQRGLRGFGSAITGVQAKLLGLAGVAGTGALLSGLIRTNIEFQTLKSSLKSVMGSTQAADQAFKTIEEFALTTPYALKEVVQSFIKLKNLGLDPSKAALTSYGNTASAMGKSLDQMIEAVADAATGEFERLKEFGIKAKRQGANVSFTFRGVAKTIGNNAQEITKYLQDIGNNQFGSAMADQMNNLGPAFSNLGAAFDKLAVTVGEAGLNDMVNSLTKNLTGFTNSMSDTQLHTIQNFFKGVKDGASSAAEVWNAMTWLQGDDMLKQWHEKNPDNQIGKLAPTVPGYKLGDFNRSGGSLSQLSAIQRVEAKYGDPEMRARQDKTNSILQDIADRMRNQNNQAVAG